MGFSEQKGCLYLDVSKEYVHGILNEMNIVLDDEYKLAREKRDGEDYHITIVKAKEWNKNRTTHRPKNCMFYVLGFAIVNDVALLVCEYPAGDEFNSTHKYSTREFHITVGFKVKDNHIMPKNFKIVQEVYLPVVYIFDYKRYDIYNHFITLLPELRQEEFLNDDTVIEKGAYDNYKYYDKEKALKICHEINTLKPEVNHKYVILGDKIRRVKVPVNFSKITNGLYASGSCISDHVPFLKSLGIETVISMTEWKAKSLHKHFNHVHFPTEDLTPPSKEDVDECIQIINTSKTLVHCRGGRGRAATVFYAYLLSKGMTMEQIREMTSNRYTTLSLSQIEFLENFYEHDHKPKAIVFVGLPGSGKTSLAKKIRELYTYSIHVNQDELGTKRKCMTQVALNCRNEKLVLIDRCNVTKDERKDWITYFGDKSVWCIVNYISETECIERIKHRTGHPNLNGTHDNIKNIVHSFSNKFERVTLDEGFEKVYTDPVQLLNDLNK